MNTVIISGITTALWILIEAIQFAYMAYLMWRQRTDVAHRDIQRAWTSLTSA